MVHYPNDYKWGIQQEARLYPHLKSYFSPDLVQTPPKSKYDFQAPNLLIEVKSRKNTYNKYPTTLITCNKVISIPDDTKIVFVFNFTDGVYYIEYDEELFDTFSIITFSRANLSYDEKDHYQIPINHLIKLEGVKGNQDV